MNDQKSLAQYPNNKRDGITLLISLILMIPFIILCVKYTELYKNYGYFIMLAGASFSWLISSIIAKKNHAQRLKVSLNQKRS
jgi:hypothetical protein